MNCGNVLIWAYYLLYHTFVMWEHLKVIMAVLWKCKTCFNAVRLFSPPGLLVS